jgi:Tol biopolymer transport system component
MFNKSIVSTILVILICLMTAELFAQSIGFSSRNLRNHPEIKWLTAETKHFLITYPEHLAGIENDAAAISEATYAALSANLGVTFDYKIRVYLSDEDEIMNGFAVPFPRAYTNIWVNLNDVAQNWSSSEKWLRTVIAHELAHIFHFEAVKAKIPIFGTIGTGAALTAPWTEGIAQYLTEPWHTLRGDAILRTSIYEGRPSFRDGSSLRNRQLMYASGNSQLRYFASTYGDSTLAKLLAHREKKLGGRIQIHNFPKAFQSATGKSFSAFENEWRRHMSIYYFTMAGQMDRLDSLGVKPAQIPGLFVSDVKYSPDTSKIATIGMVSNIRTYSELAIIQNDSTRKRTILAEGNFNTPISWSPDGTRIAYSSNTRGQYGSLLNDIYIIDVTSKKRTRLTHSRRAVNPVFSHDGHALYYVVNENGTGNIFRYDVESAIETRITNFSGDSQIGRIALSPNDDNIALAIFDENGSRQLVIVNLENYTELRFTENLIDDRNPVWSPDGNALAFTSFRDNVPNIFVVEVSDSIGTEERITSLFAGGTALQWLPADSLNTSGRIVLSATDTKTNNSFYILNASHRSATPNPVVNPSYEKWLTHTPPNVIASVIEPDPSLVKSISKYNAFRNLKHVSTIPFPYYSDVSGFGVGALTIFSEPLAKHEVIGFAALSSRDLIDNSIFYLNYINNTLRPSLSFNLYRNSFTGRFYDDDYLVTTNSGGYLLASLPRDWVDSPFVNATLFSRARYEFTNSRRYWDRDVRTAVLDKPKSGWQADLQTGLRMTSQKPNRFNNIHPLDGWGFESKITLASKLFSSASDYVQPDIIAYAVLPAPGQTRLYVYGRAIARWGTGLPQDYIGFGKFDELSFGSSLPGLEILYTNVERVRGFSDYVPGNRLLFGTVEYRMPLTNDLQTKIFGLFSLGRTTLATFIDGGAVWSDTIMPENPAASRAGTGIELKNVLTIGGISFTHNVGFAQPLQHAFTERNQEFYYRFKTVIPF